MMCLGLRISGGDYSFMGSDEEGGIDMNEVVQWPTPTLSKPYSDTPSDARNDP